MKELEDKSLNSARKKFHLSLFLLLVAVIYLISPIDLIPGLPPMEWVEDIPMLIAAAVYSGYTYIRLKKVREREGIS